MPSVKKISLDKPVEVRMEDGPEVFFVTVYKNGSIQIRPKGARDPEATVFVIVGSVYKRAQLRRAEADKPKRRRPVRRGMLGLERRGA